MGKIDTKKVAEDIKIFLQKHSSNRKKVEVFDRDYQFDFIRIDCDSIVVYEDTINCLEDGQFQFTFECLHEREANGIKTKVKAIIQANAFYKEIEKGYFLIGEITLDNIKDKQ